MEGYEVYARLSRDIAEIKYSLEEIRREQKYFDKKLNALMFGPHQAYMDNLLKADRELKKKEEEDGQRKAG